MSEGINNKVVQTFEDSISVKQQIIDNGSYEVLIEAGDIITESISSGGKLLLCGNGGSAAGHALLQYIEDSLLEKGWLIKE